jgi:beta-lactamase regulating signal transducer with metallopeptidase domain
MENLLFYFAKANGLIIAFYVMYVLFLRKETFFVKNRIYLILGLMVSLVVPLITFTKTVWVNATPNSNDFQEIITQNKNSIEVPIQTNQIDWFLIITSAYLIISVVIVAKIGIEIASFYKKIRKNNKQKESDYTLVALDTTENPFSFFHYIVINPKQFSEAELQHIVTHESIHVKQKHSIDVLIGKLFCALFWINPVIWLYRKAMLQNLEFIADSETFQQIENKYEYQKTLLKVVSPNYELSITNQFYQSLIKKRIIMLNKNQSRKTNVWKYATILPLLVGFMLLFQIETVAQEKENSKVAAYAVEEATFSSILTKESSNKELRELEKYLTDEKHKLKISNVKRNKKGEIIQIKLTYDFGKTYNRILERKSTEPINNIKIFIISGKDDDTSCGFEEIENEAVENVFIEVIEDKNQPTEKYWSFDNATKNGKDIVLIINGKIKGATEKVKFSFDEELGEMKEITPAEFEKKYNQKADSDKYYYEVETKKVKVVIGKWNDTDGLSENQKTKPTTKTYENTEYKVTSEFNEEVTVNHINNIKKNKNVDFKKALLIYDGKEINHEELDKISPKKIASTSILSANNKSIDKYGEKAKNGVIELKSKKYSEETDEIYMKVMKEYENKKKIELKAKENSSNSIEVIEERNKLIEERKYIIEQKKEERKKKLEDKRMKKE